MVTSWRDPLLSLSTIRPAQARTLRGSVEKAFTSYSPLKLGCIGSTSIGWEAPEDRLLVRGILLGGGVACGMPGMLPIVHQLALGVMFESGR